MRIYGEGTMQTPEGTVYLSNSQDEKNVLQSGSRLTISEFGADELVRRYKVRLALLTRFEPMIGDIDFRYRDLVYWEHDIVEQETHGIITVRFNGFRGGRKPRTYKPTFSSQFQELTIGNGGGAQVTILYTSPSVVTTYADKERPSDDEDIAVPPDGKCKIIEIRAPNETARVVDTSSSAQEWADFFALKAINERREFERTQEGSLWMCTETVQRIFVQNYSGYKL